MCGEASVTQQYAQVRWDSFAVEVLDSLYSTAPVSMHCNQSDARPFPVSPSQTSSSQLGRKHLKKRIYMFLFFSSGRETGTSSRCQRSPPPWASRSTPVRPEAPPAEPLPLPLSEWTLVTLPLFSQDKCPVTSKNSLYVLILKSISSPLIANRHGYNSERVWLQP